jgi:hypothetical protein
MIVSRDKIEIDPGHLCYYDLVMPRKRTAPPTKQPGSAIELVPTPARPPLLSPEKDAELTELIRFFNGPATEVRRQREREKEMEWSREHGPDLPPAA